MPEPLFPNRVQISLTKRLVARLTHGAEVLSGHAAGHEGTDTKTHREVFHLFPSLLFCVERSSLVAILTSVSARREPLVRPVPGDTSLHPAPDRTPGRI